MYLKEIKLRGFKSFVDETVLLFDKNITAIVGPNGCGKSNIVDALRWVLGEQAARYMRGKKMEDLIFEGSSSRSRSGYAEVSVTISNESKRITIYPYSKLDEVTVKRKYYRTGESEYYINNQQCRLKDLVDLFLDTGIAIRSLSIIEQDHIGRIINSKPEDRKIFIEEAAGIMRYKVRRDAAMSKLSSSQQNLLRVEDIANELEKQRSKLKRDAAKARRYKEQKDELRQKGLLYYSYNYHQSLDERKSLDYEIERLQEKILVNENEKGLFEQESEAITFKVDEKEQEYAALQDKLKNLEIEFKQNESYIEFAIKEIDRLKQESADRSANLSKIDQDQAQLASSIEIKNRQVEKSDSEFLIKKGERDSLLAKLSAKKSECKDLEKKINFARNAKDELSREIRSFMNRKSSLKGQLEMIDQTLSEGSVKRSVLDSSYNTIADELASTESDLSSLRSLLESERKSNEEFSLKVSDSSKEFETCKSELEALKVSVNLLSFKLDSAIKLKKSLEGYSDGAKRLISVSQDDSSSKQFVSSLIADHIELKNKEDEILISFVLGEKIKGLVISEDDDIKRSVDYLLKNNLGRTFITDNSALSAFSDFGSARDLISSDQILAADLCILKPDTPLSVKVILESFLVAEDFDEGLSLFRRFKGRYSVVSRDFVIISTDAMIVAGKLSDLSERSIVSRERMIVEYRAELEEGERKLKEKTDLLKSFTEKLSLEEDNLKRSDLKISGLSVDLRKSEELLKILLKRKDEKRSELDLFDKREVELSSKSKNLFSEINDLEGKLARLESDSSSSQDEIDMLSDQIENERSELETFTDLLKEIEIALANLKSESDSLKLESAAMRRELDQLGTRKEDIKTRLADDTDKESKIKDELKRRESLDLEYNELILKLRGELVDLEKELSLFFEKRKEIKEKVSSADQIIKQLVVDKSQLTETRAKLEVKLESIIEQGDLELNITLQELEEAYDNLVDIDSIKQRITFLKSQIGTIGDVNLGSIEEFNDIDERCSFLKKQSDDLVESISSLRSTIDSLDKKTEKLFDEAFNDISENFSKMFKRLFNGGKAVMKIVKEEDGSRVGLDIEVEPPGKKIQNINLLSAGEKSMTAIALLFAIFMRKPSPFCMLDEVDAPLDESNIYRFRDLMLEMNEKTQFIMITHSQKSMSFADRLYGVTQEEKGVSKILAVDIDDRRKNGKNLIAAN